MNILRNLDRIPAPYSTILSLVAVSSLGMLLVLWQDETRLLGFGVAAGGFLSIVFKAAAEVSDRETWHRIRRWFGGT